MLKNIKINSFLDDFAIESKNPSQSQTILRHRQSHQLILMKQIEADQHQYIQTLQTLQYQRKLYHEQLISLIDFYPQHRLNKFIVFYEFCAINLAEQFQSRIQQKRWFEESQLWSILSSLVFGLAYLQQKNVGHGSVSLYDTYLNDKGFIKICDPTIATSNPFLIVPGYYYSPQILRCVTGETTEDIDVFKSDVFALGCCMLQLSLMMQITSLFNYEQGWIDQKNIKVLINQLDKTYSLQYANFIREMLAFENSERSDLLTLKIKIFELLSLEPQSQSSRLRQSCDIKSSISSLKQSKHQNFHSNVEQKFLKNQTLNHSFDIEKPIQETVEENMSSSRRKPTQSIRSNDRSVLKENQCVMNEQKLSFSKKSSIPVASSFNELSQSKKMKKTHENYIRIQENFESNGISLSKRQSIRLEKENVYTDPQFLKMMQRQVQNIIKKRKHQKQY